ncbi:MAG: hypothetical protein AAF629_21325 [Chloroflexota bacterium]
MLQGKWKFGLIIISTLTLLTLSLFSWRTKVIAQTCTQFQPGEGVPFTQPFQVAYDRYGPDTLACADGLVYTWQDFQVQDFNDGNLAIFYHPVTGHTFVLGQAILPAYQTHYQTWGIPLSDMRPALPTQSGTTGYLVHFPNNLDVYTSDAVSGTTFIVETTTKIKYDQLDGTAGTLGFPISNPEVVQSGASGEYGFRQQFEGGEIYTLIKDDKWRALVTFGSVQNAYLDQQAGHAGQMGFPTSDTTVGQRSCDHALAVSGAPISCDVGDDVAEAGIFQSFEQGQIYYHNRTQTAAATQTLAIFAEPIYGDYQAPCALGSKANLTTIHEGIPDPNGLSITNVCIPQADGGIRRVYDWRCEDYRAVHAPFKGRIYDIDAQNPHNTLVRINDEVNNACLYLSHLEGQSLQVGHNDPVEMGQFIGNYSPSHDHVQVVVSPGACGTSFQEAAIRFKELGYVPPLCLSQTGEGLDNNGDYVVSNGQRMWVETGLNACLSENTTFCDIPDYHANFEEIEAIAQAHLSDGCTLHGTTRRFCPHQQLTLADVALMIARWLYSYAGHDAYLETLPPKLADQATIYHDLLPAEPGTPEDETFRAIELLVRDGVLDRSDVVINADTIVNRGDVVEMIMKALRQHQTVTIQSNHTFEDIQPDGDGNYSERDQAISDAANLGIAFALTGRQFSPDAPLTNADITQMLYRAFLRECADPDHAGERGCGDDYQVTLLESLRSQATVVEAPGTPQVCFTADLAVFNEGHLPLSDDTLETDGAEVCYCAAVGEYREWGHCPGIEASDPLLTTDRVAMVIEGDIPLGTAERTVASRDLPLPLIPEDQYWLGTLGDGLVYYDAALALTTNYQTADTDIPSDTINDIALDRETNEVWLATADGLALFDGTIWTQYQAGNPIKAVAVAPSGLKWIAFDYGASDTGVASFDGTTWTLYTEANGLPFAQVNALTVDASGVLWFATANGVIGNFDGTTWQALDDWISPRIYALMAVNDTIWLATDNGLVAYQTGTFTIIEPQVSLIEVTADSLGRIWVVSKWGDLGVYLNGQWLIPMPQPSFEPFWGDVCQPYHMDITGEGMGHKGQSINPQSISLEQPENVNWLLAQVAGRYNNNSRTPSQVEFTIEPHPKQILIKPMTNTDDGYTFETVLPPTDQISAFVEHPGGNTKTTRSLTLYSKRQAADLWTSVGRTTNVHVWRDNLTTYTEILAFPPLAQATDLEVTIAYADNNKDSRPVNISANAGGVSKSVSEKQPTHGRNLNILTLTLNQVPAGTRHVEVTVHSPSSNGDSAQLVGVNVRHQCLPSGALLEIIPNPTKIAEGTKDTLTVRLTPGPTLVNGAQLNLKLDPTFLRITKVTPTNVLSPTLDPLFVDPNQGYIRYAGGVAGTFLSDPADLLTIEVEALALTPNTPVLFLSEFPETDVTGANGSVLDQAIDGLVTIVPDRLYGTIDLQGRPEPPTPSFSIPLDVVVTPSGAVSPTYTFATQTDQYGQFDLDLKPIPAGTYDIMLKGKHTLSNLAQNVTLIDGENTYHFGQLLEGDVEVTSTFDKVEMIDLFTIKDAFNTCSGYPGFNDQADLDESNCVQITDFGLGSGNYNQTGPVVVQAELAERSSVNQNSGARLAFNTSVKSVDVNEITTLDIIVDPQGTLVNGVSGDFAFDPDTLEIVSFDWGDHLAFVLGDPTIDNEAGSLYFAAGAIGETQTNPFVVATITVRVKQETFGTDITPLTSTTTDVSGPSGSILSEARDITLLTQSQLFLPIIMK